MHGELAVPTGVLLAFLVTLARVAGVFVFVPMPGMKSGFEMARVVLSFTVTLALFPYWPQIKVGTSAGLLAVWMVSEAALGIGIGLAVAFAVEALGVAAQVMGLQAGYAYAQTIDPATQADSGVLVVFSQLAAGLVFFATGLDREVLRVFANSLISVPAGSFTISRAAAEPLLSAAGVMFSTGVRLALPVVAVLVMVDISLALLGRINAQLQLLTIAFPIKMLLALTIFGWILFLVPGIMRATMGSTFAAAKGLLSR
jgi:flagellar biosynthetic protein FliR